MEEGLIDKSKFYTPDGEEGLMGKSKYKYPYRGSGLNLETAPPHFEVEQSLIKFFLTIRVLC